MSHSENNRDPSEPAAAQDGAPWRPGRLLGRLRERFRTRESLRESLAEAIDEHLAGSEDFTPVERQMLINLMRIGQLRISDVMVPRADIIAVEAATGLEELITIFTSAGHSRLPIYRSTLDEPIGMVHIKDLVRPCFDAGTGRETSFSLQQIRRDILFVPPSMLVVDLLMKMRATRTHMALVIDEYGGTDGLVTIENLVEEIVGEIRDEYDPEGPVLRARDDGGYDADGRVEVAELEKACGVSLALDETEEYAETLGGLVSYLSGRVPQRGELIAHPAGLEFEILEADPRMVKRLRVHVTKKSDGAVPAAGDSPA